MDLEIEKKYEKIVRYFAKTNGETLDLQSIIFLIGVRELGEGIRKFSKREKNDLMQVKNMTKKCKDASHAKSTLIS